MTPVLSLFPGIGMLDIGFEEAGYSVFRGPDLLWGGDVRSFHVQPGYFRGIFGGPPCKHWSAIAVIGRARGQRRAPDMIPEFCRCVGEGQPDWWLMENVERAPTPAIAGYKVQRLVIDLRWLGEAQARKRHFCFGSRDGRTIAVRYSALQAFEREPTVLANGHRHAYSKKAGKVTKVTTRRQVDEAARLQGFPPERLAALREFGGFRIEGLHTMIGNGVALPMARAIAKAVREAEGA